MGQKSSELLAYAPHIPKIEKLKTNLRLFFQAISSKENLEKEYRDLAISGSALVELLEQLILQKKNALQKKNEVMISNWICGHENIYHGVPTPKGADMKLTEIGVKELVYRERSMVEDVDKDLKEASSQRRRYYALGAVHLQGNHDNFKRQLEKKGWKIVDAYKEVLD